MDKKLFPIFVLSSAVYFTQGVEALPAQGLFYYLKEALNYSPQKIMLLSSIITTAWLIKPFIGYLIDNFFSKKAWIFIAVALDIIIVLLFGCVNFQIFMLVTLLVFNSTNAAFRDVAVDGIMCVEGKKYNATGKIQGIQWISISASGLITGIVGGLIAQKWGYQAGFLFLVPVYLLVGLACYFYQDKKYFSKDSRSSLVLDLQKIFSNKQLLLVALFIFLYKYSPSFGTPLLFIQRDSFKWGKVWIGALGSIATVFQIIGAIFYYKFSAKINIKKWL